MVLSVYHQEGRPIGATNYVRVKSAAVSEVVEGVVMRVTIYPDTDEARSVARRLADEQR